MEFQPHDRAVYLPGSETLVCADLHIGRDATSDVELRLGEHGDLTRRFEALIDRFDPATVVIAGDLLHSFDHVPTGAIDTIREFEGIAEEANCGLVVTPGNHDTMLEELWEGQIEPEYQPDASPVAVAHGHVSPSMDAECYVIGHDHPTIEIEGIRRPCYLYGTDQYEGASVLMVPSFSRLPAGVRVNRMTAASFRSPLVTDTGSLRPIIYDDETAETHTFPPLGELRPFL